jgi:hypothetical protein
MQTDVISSQSDIGFCENWSEDNQAKLACGEQKVNRACSRSEVFGVKLRKALERLLSAEVFH